MATHPVDGASLYYENHGEGPPLVCVHGAWMDGDAWRPQVERFADEYRVITVDLRGHGRTGPTDDARYSVDLFADDLESLLADLGVERPILCGCSLGSMVVQTYLARHPDRARGAILAGAMQSMPPVDLPPLFKALASPVPGVAASVSLTGTRATFQQFLASIRAVTGRQWLSVDPAVRERVLDSVEATSNREFRKIFGALYSARAPDLSDVSTPALVVYGEQEAGPVKQQGREIAAALGSPEPREFADAGHLVNLDRSDAFNDAADAFFDEIAAVA